MLQTVHLFIETLAAILYQLSKRTHPDILALCLSCCSSSFSSSSGSFSSSESSFCVLNPIPQDDWHHYPLPLSSCRLSVLSTLAASAVCTIIWLQHHCICCQDWLLCYFLIRCIRCIYDQQGRQNPMPLRSSNLFFMNKFKRLFYSTLPCPQGNQDFFMCFNYKLKKLRITKIYAKCMSKVQGIQNGASLV